MYRSRRFRDRFSLEGLLDMITLPVVLVIVIALVVFGFKYSEKRQSECEARGGAYLRREDACIASGLIR